MAVEFEITKLVNVVGADGTTVEKIVFDMTATETDDVTGDRIAQAVIDAAIENPPVVDFRDLAVAYAETNNWKGQLLDRLASRKSFLARTAVLEDLSAITTAVAEDELKVAVYKLSTRKLHACKACHGHATNMRFATADEADATRAHPGCNCKIKPVKITDAEYAARLAGGATKYDLRH